MDNYYISKDIDRITFITASITAFFFASSWNLYGVMLATGQADNDWYPLGYNALINFCRWQQRNAGSSEDPDNEENVQECMPDIEGWCETERRSKFD